MNIVEPELKCTHIIVLYEDLEGRFYSSIKNNTTKQTIRVRGTEKITTLLFRVLKHLVSEN